MAADTVIPTTYYSEVPGDGISPRGSTSQMVVGERLLLLTLRGPPCPVAGIQRTVYEQADGAIGGADTGERPEGEMVGSKARTGSARRSARTATIPAHLQSQSVGSRLV